MWRFHIDILLLECGFLNAIQNVAQSTYSLEIELSLTQRKAAEES